MIRGNRITQEKNILSQANNVRTVHNFCTWILFTLVTFPHDFVVSQPSFSIIILTSYVPYDFLSVFLLKKCTTHMQFSINKKMELHREYLLIISVFQNKWIARYYCLFYIHSYRVVDWVRKKIGRVFCNLTPSFLPPHHRYLQKIPTI